MPDMNIQFKLTDNSPEVLNALKIAIQRALSECGENAKNHAWHNAPWKTGNLATSITHEEHEGGGEYASYIGTNVEYARAQELGTSRGIRPKHYLKNAVANNTAEYKQIITESFRNV